MKPAPAYRGLSLYSFSQATEKRPIIYTQTNIYSQKSVTLFFFLLQRPNVTMRNNALQRQQQKQHLQFQLQQKNLLDGLSLLSGGSLSLVSRKSIYCSLFRSKSHKISFVLKTKLFLNSLTAHCFSYNLNWRNAKSRNLRMFLSFFKTELFL